MGHARALLTAPDPEAAARIVVSKGLSVRQTEALAKAGTETSKTNGGERQVRTVDADLAALERQLGDMLGLNVQVKHAGKGGTVSLAYSSLDQLDMICQRLSGEPI
jgi:ParB family chromosome partitioning protein